MDELGILQPILAKGDHLISLELEAEGASGVLTLGPSSGPRVEVQLKRAGSDYPNYYRTSHLRGRLRSGHYISLLDAAVHISLPGIASIVARYALVGIDELTEDDPKFDGFSLQ